MDADQIQHDRITAKKALESYCLNIKERINGEEIKYKISVNDKKKLLDAIEGTFDWLVTHQVRGFCIFLFSYILPLVLVE